MDRMTSALPISGLKSIDGTSCQPRIGMSALPLPADFGIRVDFAEARPDTCLETPPASEFFFRMLLRPMPLDIVNVGFERDRSDVMNF